jgi:hypothetical protein
MTRLLLPLGLAAVLLAGCGSTKPAADGIPRLDFGYDASAPLAYRDNGRVNPAAAAVAIHDVSFQSGGKRVAGYLLEPPGSERRPP